MKDIDLDAGLIDYVRQKTGIMRRCPLWRETVAAIREALAVRPEPKSKEYAELVFITRQGGSWFKETADSPVSKETRKLLDSFGINGGRNFYCLRHTFRTVTDEAKDASACNVVMGHEDGHISERYNERGRMKV